MNNPLRYQMTEYDCGPMEVRIMQTKSEKKKSSYREPLILIAFVVIGAILGIALWEKASVLYPIG